jgi:hypothetical protein
MNAAMSPREHDCLAAVSVSTKISSFAKLMPEASTIAGLVDDYRSGSSVGEVRGKHRFSKGGLLEILADHGVKMRRQPLTEDEIHWMVKLYAERQSLNAIADSWARPSEAYGKPCGTPGAQMRPSTSA